IQMDSAQNVKATASSGDINLIVPRGAPFKVQSRSSSGEQNINIATDPAGQSLLDLDASSGDITVNYR
ncbi:MAG: DUF4097 family beta strand repeat-containing protein, partial [Kibdelosporangium sp.]